MVAAEQMFPIRQKVVGSVRKAKGGFSLDQALGEKVGEVTVKSDFAETDDDAEMLELANFRGEVRGAVADLLRGGLIAGRSAADNGGDPGVAQLQAIVARCPSRLIGKASLVQDGVHEVAGTISGKRSTGAVGSVGSWSQSEDEDAGTRIAEARNRSRPIDLVLVGSALCFSYSFAVAAKARADLAGDDGLLNLKKGRWKSFWGRTSH